MQLMNKYLEYVAHTEPSNVYHRWGFLTCLGAMLGRRYYLPFGHTHIYGNMYTMLLGSSGCRKTTAIKTAKRLLAAAGYKYFAPDRCTRERFLLDLDGRDIAEDGSVDLQGMVDLDYDPEAPRESFIVADEMMEFMGIKNVNFIGTLGVLWDYFDPSPFEDKVKNSRSVSIKDPTISILGGFTPENFAMTFPPEILSQGFFSRILLIHGERSGKRFVIPPPPDMKLQDELVADLNEISSNAFGRLEISPDAMAALEDIYLNGEDYGIDDTRFGSYNERRYTHLLKLALLHAAMDKTKTLAVDHVVQANTVLTYAERFMPMALGEFGRSKNSDVAHSIMQFLYKAGKPVVQKDLWAAVSQDLTKPEDLRTMLCNLEGAGKIQLVEIPGPKGREIAIVPVRKVSKVHHKYLDWKLLSAEERQKVVSN